MLARRHRRGYPPATNAFAAELTTEAGAPTVQLWLLRLLARTGNKLLTAISEHTALAQHLGVSLEPGPDTAAGPADADSDVDAAPSLTLGNVRRLLHGTEAHPACHALPELLQANLNALATVLLLDYTEVQVLAFCVLLKSDSVLGEYCNALDSMTDSRALAVLQPLLGVPGAQLRSALAQGGRLYQSGLLRMDHNTLLLPSKFDLLSGEFAARILHYRMESLEALRGLLNPAPAALLQPAHYAHIAADLQVLVPYLQHTLDAQHSGVNAFIYGQPGTGKTQLTRLLGVQTVCQV